MNLKKFFVTFCFMGIMINSPMAETLIGKVVAISDGDTITVLDNANRQHKIRLSGIDAPEKKQDFGNRSKQNLSDMVYGKNLRNVAFNDMLAEINREDQKIPLSVTERILRVIA